MKDKTQTVGDWKKSEKPKTKSSEVDILLHNLFKPPKNDTNYFYYTEVLSDWVHKK
jgi:hypothetical protein